MIICSNLATGDEFLHCFTLLITYCDPLSLWTKIMTRSSTQNFMCINNDALKVNNVRLTRPANNCLHQFVLLLSFPNNLGPSRGSRQTHKDKHNINFGKSIWISKVTLQSTFHTYLFPMADSSRRRTQDSFW